MTYKETREAYDKIDQSHKEILTMIRENVTDTTAYYELLEAVTDLVAMCVNYLFEQEGRKNGD